MKLIIVSCMAGFGGTALIFMFIGWGYTPISELNPFGRFAFLFTAFLIAGLVGTLPILEGD